MNVPGNQFVDRIDTTELARLLPVFRQGAHIAYAHSLLKRHAGKGYPSDWAKQKFPSVAVKNEFFEELGRELRPEQENHLAQLSADPTPNAVLAKLGRIGHPA